MPNLPHPFKKDSKTREERFLAKQAQLATTVEATYSELESNYEVYPSAALIEDFKALIVREVKALKPGAELAIRLVDLQMDFVVDGWALGAPDRERTFYHNRALLEALKQLFSENIGMRERIHLILTRDAHSLERKPDDADTVTMYQTYGAEKAAQAIAAEKKEIGPLNPEKGQFDYHCIVGTKGCAIPPIITQAVNKLQQMGLRVTSFGKTAFSAPESGLQLKEDIDISDPRFLDPSQGIYETGQDGKGITYTDFFKRSNITRTLDTGIAGEVCVFQNAMGTKEQFPGISITVVDAATTFLGISSQRAEVYETYHDAGIEYHETEGYPSNGFKPVFETVRRDYELSQMEPIKGSGFVNHLTALSFSLHTLDTNKHPKAAKRLETLIEELKTQVISFADVPRSDQDRQDFKANCLVSIEQARRSLSIVEGGGHPSIRKALDTLSQMVNLLVSKVERAFGRVSTLDAKPAAERFVFFKSPTARILDKAKVSLETTVHPQEPQEDMSGRRMPTITPSLP
eukprot:TRINITY_DN71095_c0_g1_i1.p1 TRINITY_DN71095_c0_g1~~TRINITY_DN71095_c0_g1_i1.p1  ORF type:complete len:517 (+),score=13.97 TRINITY_DN71095_c0_g1_i1:183-1733(+)